LNKAIDFLRVIALFGIFLPSIVHSQEKPTITSYYNLFDQLIGKTNSGVFNGIVYVEQYKVINERHKFFSAPNFTNGSVVYDKQPYFNLLLKYDLFDDELLTNNLERIGSPIIQLDKEKITDFTIEDHRFINIDFNIKNNESLSGFFEVLLKNDSLTLYKRHEKKIIRKANKKIRYFEFKDNNSYYIHYNNTYNLLNKTKDFNAIFPNYKTQLKNVFGRYKSIRKEDADSYMISIIKELFIIMKSNNNSI